MVSRAIKFLETHIDDDITLALLESVKDGDNSKFVELKNRIENDIYANISFEEIVEKINFVQDVPFVDEVDYYLKEETFEEEYNVSRSDFY